MDSTRISAPAVLQEEFLSCSVCYEPYTEPKTLPCLHSFCFKCLDRYIQGCAHAFQQKGFVCPMCREFVRTPNPKRHPADWAVQFKTNFDLKKMVQACRDTGVTNNTNETNVCTVHPGHDSDLYCVECERTICHLCAGISHRTCSLIVTLSEAADDRRSTLLSCESQLKKHQSKLTVLINKVDKELGRVEEDKTKCSKDIMTFASRLVEVIQERQVELMRETEKKHDEFINTVLITMEKYKNCTKEVTHEIERINSLMLKTDNEIIQHCKRFKHSEQTIDVDMAALLSKLQRVRISFVPEISLIDKTVIKMGSVCLDTKDITKRTDKPPPIVAKKPFIGRPRAMTTPATSSRNNTLKIRTISANMKEDELMPKLTDIVVLPGSSTIIVTDWNNQCVKIFCSRRDKDSRLVLSGKPWNIACLSPSHVAVSLPCVQQICVLKLTNNQTLMMLSSVIAQKRYSGLAAINEETLVATGATTPPCVDIINLGGEVLKSFVCNSSGESLWAYPAYVSTTPDNDILVSDRNAASLTCLTSDGHVRWRFEPKGTRELIEPSGVFCDHRGNICLAERRGILSLYAGGHYNGVILRTTDGDESPTRGIFQSNDGLLFATQNDDDISVYKITLPL